MARFYPKKVQAVCALLPVALLAHAAAPATAQLELPIHWEAARVEIDYRTQGLILIGDVRITQGDLSIRADHAEARGSGDSFQNSHWVFVGNVQMRGQQAASRGVLSSDRAVIDFRNSQLFHAVATGQPAHFEQTASDSGVLARARADTIDYEVPAATLRLTTDAWLLYGTTEVTAPTVVYNIEQQKMEGASGGPNGERVHITIVPQSSGKPKGKS